MAIDVAKYGFTHYLTAEHGSIFYRKQFKGFYIELMVSANIYSLSKRIEGEREMMIANRYEVLEQSQLDYLIYKGRIGQFFTDE